MAVGQSSSAFGSSVISQTEFTRPADTTAYSVNDVVSDSTSAATIRTFTNCVRINGGSGYITRGKLVVGATGASGQVYRLFLYTVAPTVINDNAANTVLYSNRSNFIGYIDFLVTSS